MTDPVQDTVRWMSLFVLLVVIAIACSQILAQLDRIESKIDAISQTK